MVDKGNTMTERVKILFWVLSAGCVLIIQNAETMAENIPEVDDTVTFSPDLPNPEGDFPLVDFDSETADFTEELEPLYDHKNVGTKDWSFIKIPSVYLQKFTEHKENATEKLKGTVRQVKMAIEVLQKRQESLVSYLKCVFPKPEGNCSTHEPKQIKWSWVPFIPEGFAKDEFFTSHRSTPSNFKSIIGVFKSALENIHEKQKEIYNFLKCSCKKETNCTSKLENIFSSNFLHNLLSSLKPTNWSIFQNKPTVGGYFVSSVGNKPVFSPIINGSVAGVNRPGTSGGSSGQTGLYGGVAGGLYAAKPSKQNSGNSTSQGFGGSVSGSITKPGGSSTNFSLGAGSNQPGGGHGVSGYFAFSKPFGVASSTNSSSNATQGVGGYLTGTLQKPSGNVTGTVNFGKPASGQAGINGSLSGSVNKPLVSGSINLETSGNVGKNKTQAGFSGQVSGSFGKPAGYTDSSGSFNETASSHSSGSASANSSASSSNQNVISETFTYTNTSYFSNKTESNSTETEELGYITLSDIETSSAISNSEDNNVDQTTVS